MSEAWNHLQEKLVFKSIYEKQVIAKESDHMINHHQPQIIIDAISTRPRFFSTVLAQLIPFWVLRENL